MKDLVPRLIEGMHDTAFKHKLLETLQSVNLTVETYIEFVQRLELIKKRITNNRTKKKRTAQTNTKFHANTVASGMLGEKTIVQPSVRHSSFVNEKITPRRCADTKKFEELKDTLMDRRGAEIFTLSTPTKTREKVKINGSDITLIPVNFWQNLGKLRLKKSTLQLKQFDGTIIKH